MKTNTILTRSLSIIFITLFLLCCKNSDTDTPDTIYPEADAQNINVEQLKLAIDKLEKISGIKSIVLGRNGVIAAEEYYNGGGADIIHDVRSVTKSVMGLLVGLAIQEGHIQSVDQTVGEFLVGTLVDTLEQEKAEITIEQLLTMSCGLEWHELDGGNSYGEWYYSDDQIMWVLEQAFIHDPGNGFNYNTGSTHLLSAILTQTTGEKALAFAQSHLLEPIGIEQSDWTTISKPEVLNNGGAGLKISPHAMFTIGNFALNAGVWNQTQIVPAEWVNNCISEQNTTDNAIPYSSHYGYLWWLGQAHGHDHFFAMGWGGQFIVCVPDFDLVVVATCKWSGVGGEQAGQNWYDIFMIIIDDILPAVNS
jgi:CubicO group peptidase (beta-lactamase class C family)